LDIRFQEQFVMSLIDLVKENVVKVPLEANDKPDVLRELVRILVDAGEIDDFDAVLQAIQEREKKGSTGLEKGIAVPHCKSPAVTTLKFAMGIAPQGIDFDAMDKQPSKLFFLLVAAPNQAGPHVAALAEIAKLTRSNAFCNALTAAENPKEVVELMQGE
jgi:fructose-specific phosphotransferase system IIA component